MSAAPAAGDDRGVVRIAHFHPQPGREAALRTAAGENAGVARKQPGCLSAEVCEVPASQGELLVVSRWESHAALRAFLDWHERIAHELVQPAATSKPEVTHYPVVGDGR